VKEYKFSVTVDTRKPRKERGEGGFYEVVNNLFVKNYQPSTWLVRRVVIDSPDFQTARTGLINEAITAPIYYILAGNHDNEGTVIERKPDGPYGVRDLNSTTWYLV
jgi:hypothetical protein